MIMKIYRKIDLNFDMKTNSINLKVQEELSKRCWSLTMSESDVSGKIREYYQTLGQSIANGTADYVYPKDSGAVKVKITYQNNEYNFSVPQDYS